MGLFASLRGGKFANGAVTAAMAYAFNQVVSSAQDEERTTVSYTTVEEPQLMVGKEPRTNWMGVDELD